MKTTADVVGKYFPHMSDDLQKHIADIALVVVGDILTCLLAQQKEARKAVLEGMIAEGQKAEKRLYDKGSSIGDQPPIATVTERKKAKS
jgi:hypothetical protein